jgi:hypothetical protein
MYGRAAHNKTNELGMPPGAIQDPVGPVYLLKETWLRTPWVAVSQSTATTTAVSDTLSPIIGHISDNRQQSLRFR